jgi:hypothetical protein
MGSNGLPNNLFLGCCEFIESDPLNMVDLSHSTPQSMVSLKYTFLELISKIDSPSNFECFKPISFYNIVYKIISILICQRIKIIISKHIPFE